MKLVELIMLLDEYRGLMYLSHRPDDRENGSNLSTEMNMLLQTLSYGHYVRMRIDRAVTYTLTPTGRQRLAELEAMELDAPAEGK
jgi:DNA-binding MarR family transcriptional regulator